MSGGEFFEARSGFLFGDVPQTMRGGFRGGKTPKELLPLAHSNCNERRAYGQTSFQGPAFLPGKS